MSFKESFSLLFFSFLESFYFLKKGFEKNFFFFSKGISELIKKNGIIAGNFFLRPKKMFPILRFIRFVYLKKIKLMWGGKNFQKKKNSVLKIKQIKRDNQLFSTIFPEPNKVGRLVFIEGIVIQTTPPMTKKTGKKRILLFKNFNTKKDFPEENLNKKLPKKLSNVQVDYQEIKIFSFARKKKKEEIFGLFLTKIVFTKNLLKIHRVGDKISLWGIARNRFLSSLNFRQNINVDFFIHTFLFKIKKKKEIKPNFDKGQTLKMFDSLTHWQDTKIRGVCLFKRNYTLSYLFPRKELSLFFKIIILICFLGGFSVNLNSGKKKSSNLCVVGEDEWKKIIFIKILNKFWKNFLFLSSDSSPKIEFSRRREGIFLSKKLRWGLVSKLMSEIGVVLFDTVPNQEKYKKNFFGDINDSFLLKKLQRDFFKSIFFEPILIAFSQFKPQIDEFQPRKEELFWIWQQKLFFPNSYQFKFETYFDILFFFQQSQKIIKRDKNIQFSTKKIWKIFANKKRIGYLSITNGFRKWSECNFKNFFFFVKSFGKPRFSQEGENFLLFWYKRESLKKTLKGKEILLLEKLIRLSEAHARFLLQDFVLFNDCVLAFFLVHYSFVTNHVFIASDIFFDFSQTTLNIFSSFQQFSPFFFLRNFKVLGGLKGLAGGTLNIMKEKQGLST